jgi:hypothetical protein
MQAWFNFYAVIGASAATLTGLLFVAVSMNAVVVLSKGPQGSRQAAAEPSVHEKRLVTIRRHASTLIGFGLLIYSAGRMALDGNDMLNTLAAANIVLLFSATERARGLLNRIAAAW